MAESAKGNGGEFTLGDKIETGAQLAAACLTVAKQFKTLYVMGCFGAPMSAANKARYCDNHSYNRKAERQRMIKAATADTFGFDCVCMIKGLLWGWNGDTGKTYGGAKYASNGVRDLSANQMINVCTEISTDFGHIEIGEAVWMEGHIGVYVGDGLAVECTPSWKNCVQVTACNRSVAGYNRRNWKKHGKLPYVTYAKTAGNSVAAPVQSEGADMPTLRRGDKGSTVKAVQALLIGYGYGCGSAGVDGSFGGATNAALLDYQEDHGLEPDGVCGPKTWNSLLGL